MSIENLLKVTSSQQWALDKESDEVQVIKKRNFIGRVIDRLRGSNKLSEIIDGLCFKIRCDSSLHYKNVKGKVQLRDRVVQLSSEYYNKTSCVGRFLRGHGDVASSAKEVTEIVDVDLNSLFANKIIKKVDNDFAQTIYDGLTNLNSTSQELNDLVETMQKYYGDNYDNNLIIFADLQYPLARFLKADEAIQNMNVNDAIKAMKDLEKQGVKLAKYRLVDLHRQAAVENRENLEVANQHANQSFLRAKKLGITDNNMWLVDGINTLVGFGTIAQPPRAMEIAEEILLKADLPAEIKSKAEDLKSVATVLSSPLSDLTRSNIESCLPSLDRLFVSSDGQSMEENRNAFLEKLSDGVNAAASYLLYSCTGEMKFLERAAIEKLPLAQSDWAYNLNRKAETCEAAFEWAVKACEVDEKAKLLVADFSMRQGNVSLARQYALELVSSSDVNIQEGALNILDAALKVSLNRNSELFSQFNEISNKDSRKAYAFMLEHGLGVERNLDLAIQQYTLCGENLLANVADVAIRDHRYEDAFAFYSAAIQQGDVKSRLAAIRMIRYGLIQRPIKEALSLCALPEGLERQDVCDIFFEKAELLLSQNKGRFSSDIIKLYESVADDARARARLVQYSHQPGVIYQLIECNPGSQTDLISEWSNELPAKLEKVLVLNNQGALSASLRFELEELKCGDHTKLAAALNKNDLDEDDYNLLGQYADFVNKMSPQFHKQALERVAKLVFSTSKVSTKQIGALEYALTIIEDRRKKNYFFERLACLCSQKDPEVVRSEIDSLRDLSLGKNWMPKELSDELQGQISHIANVITQTYMTFNGVTMVDARSLYSLANIVYNSVNPVDMKGVLKLIPRGYELVGDSLVDSFAREMWYPSLSLDYLLTNYFGKNLVPLNVVRALRQGEELSKEDYNNWIWPLASRYNVQDMDQGPKQLNKIAQLLLNTRQPTHGELAKIQDVLARSKLPYMRIW